MFSKQALEGAKNVFTTLPESLSAGATAYNSLVFRGHTCHFCAPKTSFRDLPKGEALKYTLYQWEYCLGELLALAKSYSRNREQRIQVKQIW